jgi:hypothetical protein
VSRENLTITHVIRVVYDGITVKATGLKSLD